MIELIRLWLRWIKVKLAGACIWGAMRLLDLVGPKPAKRAKPAPASPAAQWKSVPGATLPVFELPPPRSYVPFTEKHLDHLRGIAAREGWPEMRLCRGPKKGCNRYCDPPEDCSSCFIVPWHERRPSAELIQAMERGDA